MGIKHRFSTAAVALVTCAGMLAVPNMAGASEQGRRNTALALGAAAGYLLLTQKDKTMGLVAGAGAAYAYKRYDDSVRDRHNRERYGYYDGYYNDRNDRYGSRYGNTRYDGSYRYDGSRYDRYDGYDSGYSNTRYDRYDDPYYNDRYNRYDTYDRYDTHTNRYDRNDDCYRSRRR